MLYHIMTLSTCQCISREAMLDRMCRMKNVFVLDCRSSLEFSRSHIRHAINVNIPTLILRRLSAGKISVSSIIVDSSSREHFERTRCSHIVVLCGNGTTEDSSRCSVINILYNHLVQEDYRVFCLEGGFLMFRSEFPEWCEDDDTEMNYEIIMGLQTLRPCKVLSADSGDCSVVSPEMESSEDDAFTVEILPRLYLGSAKTSEKRKVLHRHNIKYILNVTCDLPNVFEEEEDMKYMQIPVSDKLTEDILCYFPSSIAFIDEALDQGFGVLVHCLAGVSRSVTIILAYLMFKRTLSFNEAFEFVKKKKTNISPNLTFLGQLNIWEQHLASYASNCSSFLNQKTSSSIKCW